MWRVASILTGVSLIAAGVAWARTERTPAAVLAGRVAGPPTECISSFERDRGGQIFDDGSILYEGRGDTVYLNRPPGCTQLKSDRAVVSTTPTDRLCRGDIIQVIDPPSPIQYGACSLGDFVPYARPTRR